MGIAIIINYSSLKVSDQIGNVFFLRCATVALSYGHSKVASYLQEALRQNEENKEE